VPLCLVLALALGPPAAARAAPAAESCIAGLPTDLSSQLQPLLQALCEANQAGATGVAGANQRDIELIAEAMALLALADPGYSYGYGPPSYSTLPPPSMPAVPPPENIQAGPSPDVAPADQQADDVPADPPPDEVVPCSSGPP